MQPYNISIVDHDYFEFTTAAGTIYACYFLSYAEYFKKYKSISENIYAYNVDAIEIKNKNIAIDERTGLTIVTIVKQFLEKQENAVVYVCDSADGKALMRKRKFDQWFKKYDDGTIIKIDGFIEAFDMDIYNAVLIHKDNPKKNRFIEAFIDLNLPDDNKRED